MSRYLFMIQYLHQGWDLCPDSSSKGHIRLKHISCKLNVSNKALLDGKMQYAIPPYLNILRLKHIFIYSFHSYHNTNYIYITAI